MVVVAQLVRASVCGTEGRRFEPGLPPKRQKSREIGTFFVCLFFIEIYLELILKIAQPPLFFMGLFV